MNAKGRRAVQATQRPLLWSLLAIALAAFAGCQHYNAEVTIEPDGSGQRTIDFTVDSSGDDEFPLTHEDLRELLHIDAAHGWKLVSPVRPAADEAVTGVSYRHEATFAGPAAWSQADGDLRIQANRQGHPQADVVFDNDLDVHLVESPKGHILHYRETFSWTGLRQQITAFMADRFVADMHAAYPFLTGEELRELHGLVAGMVMLHLQAAGDHEDAEPDDDLIAAAMTAHAEDILRRHASDLDTAEIRAIVSAAADDPMDLLDQYLAEELPGAYHAASTELHIAVTMPGPITDSNAERVDGHTAIWEMSIWDASAHPVEIFVAAKTSE